MTSRYSTQRKILADLDAGYRHGRCLVLLFDYDGTLAPIAAHPRLARIPSVTLSSLERLSKHPRVRVGVLSGRAIDDLKAMVGLTHVCYAGTSGLEIDLGASLIVHPRAAEIEAVVQCAIGELAPRVAKHAGAWIEAKRLGCTVHYRMVAEHERADVRDNVYSVIASFGCCLRCVEGPLAVEVAPAVGWTKGSAVSMLLAAEDHAACFPFYAGDSDNDREALETTDLAGGISVGVGHYAPPSRYRLPDVAALSSMLSQLVDQLASTPRPNRRSTEELLALDGVWRMSVPRAFP